MFYIICSAIHLFALEYNRDINSLLASNDKSFDQRFIDGVRELRGITKVPKQNELKIINDDATSRVDSSYFEKVQVQPH